MLSGMRIKDLPTPTLFAPRLMAIALYPAHKVSSH